MSWRGRSTTGSQCCHPKGFAAPRREGSPGLVAGPGPRDKRIARFQIPKHRPPDTHMSLRLRATNSLRREKTPSLTYPGLSPIAQRLVERARAHRRDSSRRTRAHSSAPALRPSRGKLRVDRCPAWPASPPRRRRRKRPANSKSVFAAGCERVVQAGHRLKDSPVASAPDEPRRPPAAEGRGRRRSATSSRPGRSVAGAPRSPRQR